MSRVRIINETERDITIVCSYGEDKEPEVVLELPPGVWFEPTVPLPYYWRIVEPKA